MSFLSVSKFGKVRKILRAKIDQALYKYYISNMFEQVEMSSLLPPDKKKTNFFHDKKGIDCVTKFPQYDICMKIMAF